MKALVAVVAMVAETGRSPVLEAFWKLCVPTDAPNLCAPWLTCTVCRTRRTNGATQTFRRSSLATNSSHQKDTSQAGNDNPPPSSGVYVPPHLNSNYQSSYTRNGASAEGSRYSKDQLLDMFRAQGPSGQLHHNISDLFVDGWNPSPVNGTTNGGWARRDDQKEAPTGPDICWDHEGKIQPLSLIDMSEEEKQVRRSPGCWIHGC